jgi:hypothetical protein
VSCNLVQIEVEFMVQITTMECLREVSQEFRAPEHSGLNQRVSHGLAPSLTLLRLRSGEGTAQLRHPDSTWLPLEALKIIHDNRPIINPKTHPRRLKIWRHLMKKFRVIGHHISATPPRLAGQHLIRLGPLVYH